MLYRVGSKGDLPMAAWTRDELNKIGSTEELQIAAERANGQRRN